MAPRGGGASFWPGGAVLIEMRNEVVVMIDD